MKSDIEHPHIDKIAWFYHLGNIRLWDWESNPAPSIEASNRQLFGVTPKIGTFILALSTFSHNVRLCITANVCILGSNSRIRTRYIRTARRHKVSIKDAQDCWSNSRALCEKFSEHTHRQRCLHCANTKLSSLPNKYRQNYSKMCILANILINTVG